mgnify:CR=1 FL=1
MERFDGRIVPGPRPDLIVDFIYQGLHPDPVKEKVPIYTGRTGDTKTRFRGHVKGTSGCPQLRKFGLAMAKKGTPLLTDHFRLQPELPLGVPKHLGAVCEHIFIARNKTVYDRFANPDGCNLTVGDCAADYSDKYVKQIEDKIADGTIVPRTNKALRMAEGQEALCTTALEIVDQLNVHEIVEDAVEEMQQAGEDVTPEVQEEIKATVETNIEAFKTSTQLVRQEAIILVDGLRNGVLGHMEQEMARFKAMAPATIVNLSQAQGVINEFKERVAAERIRIEEIDAADEAVRAEGKELELEGRFYSGVDKEVADMIKGELNLVNDSTRSWKLTSRYLYFHIAALADFVERKTIEYMATKVGHVKSPGGSNGKSVPIFTTAVEVHDWAVTHGRKPASDSKKLTIYAPPPNETPEAKVVRQAAIEEEKRLGNFLVNYKLKWNQPLATEIHWLFRNLPEVIKYLDEKRADKSANLAQEVNTLLLKGYKYVHEEIEGEKFPKSINKLAYAKMNNLVSGSGTQEDLERMVKGLHTARADWFRHQYATNLSRAKERNDEKHKAKNKRGVEATGKETNTRKMPKVDEASTSGETNEVEEEEEEEEGEEDSEA